MYSGSSPTACSRSLFRLLLKAVASLALLTPAFAQAMPDLTPGSPVRTPTETPIDERTETSTDTPADYDSKCRDCVFPMSLGENRWLMPNGRIEITIKEKASNDGRVIVSITLTDIVEKTEIARGCARRPKYRDWINIRLVDNGGNKVRGRIQWVDRENSVIQAKFRCSGHCIVNVM